MSHNHYHHDSIPHTPDEDFHENDDDETYAFPSTIVDLTLPEPPMDVPPLYVSTTATGATVANTNIDGTLGGDADDETTAAQVLYQVPTRFNYVTANTTKVIVRRDVHGNDHSTPLVEEEEASHHETDMKNIVQRRSHANGIGWFTNHRTMYVENGRLRTNPPYTLHTNGFELISLRPPSRQQPTVFTIPHSTWTIQDWTNHIDYTNRNEVLEQYYPYCQELLQQVLLQKYGDHVQVWAFDHNVRRQSSPSESPTDVDGTTTTPASTSTTVIQPPIGLVHGDYTTISAPRRLELLSEPPKINDVYYEQFQTSSDSKENNSTTRRTSLLDPKLVQECLTDKSSDDPSAPPQRRRYALINVWKNIDPHHPVLALPLACVDATTVSMEEDVRTLELHYTDRIGENYLACHPSSHAKSQSPRRRREHQWVYYPQMTQDEVLLIKQWDSAGTDITKDAIHGSGGHDENGVDADYISTMALHSAFIDPTTPTNNTIHRQSIEVRCVVIWV